MLNKLTMLKYSILNGIIFPFKIYIKSSIKIRNTSTIKIDGRITIGNPDTSSAIISKAPANIYFGYDSKIYLGKSISIGPGVNIIAKDKARLSIGENTYFTSDSHIEAVDSIVIGSDCAISWGVTIIDNNHHKVITKIQKEEIDTNLVIGNHVWIGCNVTILKGTEIGNNCIVAAGSVVKGVFSDNMLIAGNPAKVVKEEVNWG